MPTSAQMLAVTTGLSPVSTLTATPCSRSARMALRALSLGGSRNVRMPSTVRPHSSSLTSDAFLWSDKRFLATISTRNPCLLKACVCSRSPWARSGVSGTKEAPSCRCVQMLSISSTAPLQIKQRSSEAVSSTSTDTRRRTKSKGSSSSFIKRSRTVRSK